MAKGAAVDIPDMAVIVAGLGPRPPQLLYPKPWTMKHCTLAALKGQAPEAPQQP